MVKSMEPTVNKTTATITALVSLFTSIGALFAASCCALPLALSLAGIGGAWLGGLGALAVYRIYFLAAAAGALALAWAVVLWRRNALCRTDAACRQPQRSWLTFGALGLSTSLVGVAAAWDWLEPVIMTGLMRLAAAA